jgi:CMP-N,N'-diacetyllegionaminic acid synthase
MNIAFIPAKGDSTEIPNKNLKVIKNTTLAKKTFDFALRCKNINLVVLSTDNIKIVNSCVGKLLSKSDFYRIPQGKTLQVSNRIIIHRRLDKHCLAESKTVEPVINFISNSKNFLSNEDSILILQPTTPFRNQLELNSLLSLRSKSDSIVSVSLADHPHPKKTFKINSRGGIKLNKFEMSRLSAPRQKFARYFALDGGYYLVKVQHILKYNAFISKETLTFPRSGIETISIDNLLDLKIARSIANKTYNK